MMKTTKNAIRNKSNGTFNIKDIIKELQLKVTKKYYFVVPSIIVVFVYIVVGIIFNNADNK